MRLLRPELKGGHVKVLVIAWLEHHFFATEPFGATNRSATEPNWPNVKKTLWYQTTEGGSSSDALRNIDAQTCDSNTRLSFPDLVNFCVKRSSPRCRNALRKVHNDPAVIPTKILSLLLEDCLEACRDRTVQDMIPSRGCAGSARNCGSLAILVIFFTT